MRSQRLISQYRVFISSPSDVSNERAIAVQVIDRHNRSPFAREKNYRLAPLWYEEGTTPSAGQPQAIIDVQMGRSDDCDLVI